MGLSKLTLFLSLGTSLMAATTAAEPPAPKDKVEAGATVTVTAEANPVELEATPNPVRVMDLEALERLGARSGTEILEQLLPGQVLSYGGPGALGQLYLGGSRPEDTVVTLDGIRINDAASTSCNFGTLSLAGVTRVEILMGPSSTRYGADTHGGVMALSSSAPAPQGFSGSALVGGGTRGQARTEVDPAYGWGSGWVRTSGNLSREDASIAADERFRTAGGSVNLGQQLGSFGLVTVTYRHQFVGVPLPFTSEFDMATYASTPVFDPARGSGQRSEQLVGSLRSTLGSTLFGEISLGHVVLERAEPDDYHYFSQRNQAVGSLTWTPDTVSQTTLVLDLSREQAWNTVGTAAHPTAQGSHAALALEQSLDLPGALRLVGSLRLQRDRLNLENPDGSDAIPERGESQLVYKLGANWRITPQFRVYASHGTSYNTPTLYALANNHTLGRPLPENEKSRGTQLGSSWSRAGWTARLEASRTRYDRVIYWEAIPGQWTGVYLNGRQLRIQSLEGSLGYGTETWGLRGFLRSQEARNESVAEDRRFQVSGAAGRPFFMTGLEAHWIHGSFRVDGGWSYVGSLYAYDESAGGVVANHTHFNDLRGSLAWTPVPAFTLTLKGTHLLQGSWSREAWLAGEVRGQNDAYLLPNYPAQGRTFTLEARYRF